MAHTEGHALRLLRLLGFRQLGLGVSGLRVVPWKHMGIQATEATEATWVQAVRASGVRP